MINGWLLSRVTFLSKDRKPIEVEPGTTIVVTVLPDGGLVGVYGVHTFDLCDDEYVALTGLYSFYTH